MTKSKILLIRTHMSKEDSMTPRCKYSVKKGNGGRFTRRCDVSATEAVVFTSELGDGYKIQTQMPICSAHLTDKVETLKALGVPYFLVKLGG
jgi:hypothetical protein